MPIPTDPDLAPVVSAQALAPEAALVWVFDVTLSESESIRVVGDTQAVTFAGNQYLPLPIKVESITEDGDGGLPELSVTLGTIPVEIARLVNRHNGLTGASVTLRLISRAHTGSGAKALRRYDGDIRSSIVTREACAFRIGAPTILSREYPGERVMRGFCRHVYKGDACAYSGPLETCDRTLRGANGCEAHGNQLRYGGFAGLPRQ